MWRSSEPVRRLYKRKRQQMNCFMTKLSFIASPRSCRSRRCRLWWSDSRRMERTWHRWRVVGHLMNRELLQSLAGCSVSQGFRSHPRCTLYFQPQMWAVHCVACSNQDRKTPLWGLTVRPSSFHLPYRRHWLSHSSRLMQSSFPLNLRGISWLHHLHVVSAWQFAL